MRELLDIATKAHGGLDRWNRVNSIRVNASVTGAIWFVKGKPDVLQEVVITAEVKRERVTMELPGKNRRMIFQPDRVEIHTAQGAMISLQDDPEGAGLSRNRRGRDHAQLGTGLGKGIQSEIICPNPTRK